MNVSLFLEIKNEYTEHLIDTISPFIYEGMNSIYREAVNIAQGADSNDKILLIFQKLLKSISDWNQNKIDEETNRIKIASNTSEYLDDLVKAVIKSNIILLTYSNSISNMIAQTFYNNLTTSTLIHRCYTECAKDIHNNPYLFFHDVHQMDFKRNQIIIQQNIQSGISRAIRKILPISVILKEYLVNSVNIINEPINKIEQPVNNKLQKEVMNIIKTDGNKSDKQKVKSIITIDKILNSIENKKPKEMDQLNIQRLMRKSDKHINDNRLSTSDKKIINIDIDEKEEEHKSVSVTTISNNPQYKNMFTKNSNPETSEKIDPKNIKLIEAYKNRI